MSLPAFTSTNKLTDNEKLTTIQVIVRVYNALISNLLDIFTALLKKVQLDSILLTNITVSGPTIIPHTLGRTLTGWQIVRQSGPALLWDNQTTAINPQTYLYLDSTAKVVVSLLVF